MDNFFVGQIMLWAGNFAPYRWLPCEGQLLPIRQYSTLYSILGNIYGGDGQNTFALPDLRGRAICHTSQTITAGTKFGTESYQLTNSQMPAHQHTVDGTVAIGCNSGDQEDFSSPANAYFKAMNAPVYADAANDKMGVSNVDLSVGVVGNSLPVSNLQPSLVLTYCICIDGVFPQRP
jgi:microcystin-dependent protein